MAHIDVGDEFTRGTHNDIRPLRQGDLFLYESIAIAPAVNGDRAEVREIGESVEVPADLYGEFPGRDDDQRIDVVVRTAALDEPLEDRQEKGACFAGTRLCGGDDVPAGEDQGDDLFLHRRGIFPSAGVDAFLQGFVKLEFSELQMMRL